MIHLLLLILTYFALVFDAAFAEQLAFRSMVPHALPLVLTTALLTVPGWPALCWAALIGLLLDGHSGCPLGTNMLGAIGVALAVQQIRIDRTTEPLPLFVGFCFGVTVPLLLLQTIVDRLSTGSLMHVLADLPLLAGTGLYSALLAGLLAGGRRLFGRLFFVRQSGSAGMLSNRWTMLTD